MVTSLVVSCKIEDYFTIDRLSPSSTSLRLLHATHRSVSASRELSVCDSEVRKQTEAQRTPRRTPRTSSSGGHPEYMEGINCKTLRAIMNDNKKRTGENKRASFGPKLIDMTCSSRKLSDIHASACSTCSSVLRGSNVCSREGRRWKGRRARRKLAIRRRG